MRIGDFAAMSMGVGSVMVACGGTVATTAAPDGGIEGGVEAGNPGSDGEPHVPCQTTMGTLPTGPCDPATACGVTVNEPCCGGGAGAPSSNSECSCAGGMWACSSTVCGPCAPSDGGPGPSLTCGSVAPGAFPPPTCTGASGPCPTTQACNLSQCPVSTSAGSCEPLAQNAGSTLDFRIRRLNVASPSTLASAFVQQNVITPAVELGSLTACGEESMGTGTLNWLLQVNKSQNTLTMGGAPPSTNPVTAGYCFYDFTVGTGQDVIPVTGPLTFSGATFSSAPFTSTLYIPIFMSSDLSSPLLLPIRGASLVGVTISPDSNCIGTFDPDALSSQCTEDPGTCPKWDTAGSLGGFITLADADQVNVTLLDETLCVLLTGTPKSSNGGCMAAALTMGDYCSTTNSPGGCDDSMWLAGTFAASAVGIHAGAGAMYCQ